MELSAQLPAELLALAAPAGRTPLELLPPGDAATDDSAAAAPFDMLLLQLAGTAMPSGDALPASGNGLPSASSDLPEVDAPQAPTDASAASALAALSMPLPQAAQLPPPPLATNLTATADVVSPAAVAPATPDELATLQQLRAALDGAAAPTPASTPNGAPGADVFGAPADLATPDAAAAEVMPAAARTSADVAPQASTSSTSDRVVATFAAAAQGAPSGEAAASAAASIARPANELRSSADRRAPTASAEAASASAAPPSQLFDLQSVTTAADRAVIAPKAVPAGEPLPITPSAVSASADALPIAPAHSPTLGTPSTASPAVDGSAAASTATSPQHGGSVDTTAARWHDALANRVQWLVDHDIGEARIKLNPPELGALDVKISMHDDKTFVQLTSHNAAARDELTQSLPRLRDLLSANGLELGGATVSGGRDDHAGRQQAAAFATSTSDFADADDSAPAVRSILGGGSSSRIDTFA